MSEPLISVIVPAYNCADTIKKTLEAIVNQEVSSRIEIIVVDDGSSDQTPQVINSFSQVKSMRQQNSGPAAARNWGARAASGQYLFFTDSDCAPHKDWLRKMLPHFDDDRVAVVAGSYGIANPQNLLARCIHQEILFRHQRMPQYPSYFGSFNFAIRREIFMEVAGFDESYRNASGEDNDLSYKVIGIGHKIYFAKDALVDHVHTEQVGKYLKEQYRHGFWRAKMYRRHPQMGKGDGYTFWKDIAEIPLVLLLVACAALLIWKISLMKIVLSLLGVLLLLEIYYGLLITKDFVAGLFWAGAMLARAAARSLGFVFGLFRFFLKA
jgi:glycosyltransferase involved in cell wall biosynthesis